MSIPQQEFSSRIAKVKQILDRQDLDLLFIYFDEFSVMNGRYLTGWCPSVEKGAVIVSRQAEPFLVGGPEAAPFARLDSFIKKTANSSVFMVPEEEYPGADLLSFGQIVDRYLGTRKIRRVGLVGGNTVPHLIYRQLSQELPEARLVDVTDDYERLRYVKSDWEMQMMGRAYAAADEGLRQLMGGIRSGKREYEAAAEAEYAARKLGCEGYGYRTIIGTAERSSGIIPAASDRVFRDGELVLTGFAPRYNGYNATACFPVVVGGKPSGIQEKWIKDVCEAYLRTREAIRPGLTGVEIDGVPRKFLQKKGYSDYMPMPFVHSTGLSEYERPFFGPHSDDVIEENMTLCIDVALFGHPDIPGIRVESGLKVTGNGAVPLSSYLESLMQARL